MLDFPECFSAVLFVLVLHCFLSVFTVLMTISKTVLPCLWNKSRVDSNSSGCNFRVVVKWGLTVCGNSRDRLEFFFAIYLEMVG